MKNKFMRGAALGLAMVTAFTFTAPNSALLNAEAAAKKQATAATKITAKAASVKVGKTAKVTVKINKKATKKVTINVKAKNAKVAKVAKTLTIKKGKDAATLKVKGLKKGSTNVTLSFKNSKGKNVKKTIKVTVKKAAVKTVAATGVTFGKASYSVGVGQTTTLDYTVDPVDTTDTATWTSSDESVATVANGVVTGVKEGKATITVAFNENVVATTEVNVSKEAIIYNLTGVKQTAANKVELTFDNPEAKNLTDKDTILIQNKANSYTHHIETITWDSTGTVGVAKVSTAFTDKAEYDVAFKGATPLTFTASVGEVASVSIATSVAQRGVATKIDFALLDANGMDVTATESDLSNVVTITSDGGNLENESNPEKATIKLDTEGDVANVTVTYNSRKADAADISATAKITCVKAEAVVGTPVFKATSKTNAGSSCARFYLGEADEKITLETESDESNVFFFAKDENGKAISYEKYEVTSANENIATAEIADKETDSKFTRIKISSGTKTGTTNINVLATVNDVTTPYVIPVNVIDQAKLSSIVLSADKSTITNAIDKDYYGELTIKGRDSKGDFVKLENITVEFNKEYSASERKNINTFTDATTKIGDGLVFNSTKAGLGNSNNKDSISVSSDKNDDGVEEAHAYYQAWGAEAKSYTFKVTGEYRGVTKTNTISVTVSDLGKENFYATNGKGASLKYEIELNKSTVDEAKVLDSKVEARLVAKIGSKFAGYVRMNNTSHEAVIGSTTSEAANIDGNYSATTTITTGSVVADKAIKNIKIYVKASNGKYATDQYAAKLFKATSNVTGTAADLRTNATALVADFVNTNAGAGLMYAPGTAGSKYDPDFAKVGTYTIGGSYEQLKSDGSKYENLTFGNKTVSVKNTLVTPKVTYESLKVDSLDESSVKEVLVADVDLNNNDSQHESIGNLYNKVDTDKLVTSEEKNSTYSVNYVGVTDTVYVKDEEPKQITFIVPMTAAFKTK